MSVVFRQSHSLIKRQVQHSVWNTTNMASTSQATQTSIILVAVPRPVDGAAANRLITADGTMATSFTAVLWCQLIYWPISLLQRFRFTNIFRLTLGNILSDWKCHREWENRVEGDVSRHASCNSHAVKLVNPLSMFLNWNVSYLLFLFMKLNLSGIFESRV